MGEICINYLERHGKTMLIYGHAPLTYSRGDVLGVLSESIHGGRSSHKSLECYQRFYRWVGEGDLSLNSESSVII